LLDAAVRAAYVWHPRDGAVAALFIDETTVAVSRVHGGAMTRISGSAARAVSRTSLIAIALAAVAAVAAAQGTPPSQGSQSNQRVRTREINGFQETNPSSVMTTGVGQFEAKIYPTFIEYTLTYEGLEGGATLFAHIHFARDGVTGGVVAFLCGGGGKPPCPPVAGTVTGVITAADVVGPANQGIEPGNFEELVRALRTGTAYANIHTTRFPAGEVRGQIRDDRDIKDTP
jgi:CHRD domain